MLQIWKLHFSILPLLLQFQKRESNYIARLQDLLVKLQVILVSQHFSLVAYAVFRKDTVVEFQALGSIVHSSGLFK